MSSSDINIIIANLEKYKDEARLALLKALEIEGKKSIDLNFRNQGRPDKWKAKQSDDGRKVLTRSGILQLRTVAIMDLPNNRVRIGNNLPYNKIHNEGGKIKMTSKMRGYFWYRYYDAGGGKKAPANGERPEDPTSSLRWKYMALSKKGFVEISKREYLIIPPSDYPRILKNCGKVLNSIKVI